MDFRIIQNALGKIQQVAQRFTQPLVQQVQTLPQQVQATGQLMQQGLQDRGNQVSEGVASIPYNYATFQRNNRIQNGVPPFQKISQKNYQNANQYGKLAIDSIIGDGAWQPTAGASAEKMPLFNDINPVPQTNSYLEGIKRKVLNDPNMRPSAREYLSKIPIAYENMDKGTLAQAHNAPELQNKYIGVSEKFNEPVIPALKKHEQEILAYREQELTKIIQHELLHQTPRLVPTELFHPQNQPIVDKYTEQWGEKYMQRPKALIEEMFAQQDLPPAYYWHIFKNVNPQSTKQDFISYLKSWFTNELTNQVQAQTQPQPTFGAMQGTMIPNSGGGPVQQ